MEKLPWWFNANSKPIPGLPCYIPIRRETRFVAGKMDDEPSVPHLIIDTKLLKEVETKFPQQEKIRVTFDLPNSIEVYVPPHVLEMVFGKRFFPIVTYELRLVPQGDVVFND